MQRRMLEVNDVRVVEYCKKGTIDWLGLRVSHAFERTFGPEDRMLC